MGGIGSTATLRRFDFVVWSKKGNMMGEVMVGEKSYEGQVE